MAALHYKITILANHVLELPAGNKKQRVEFLTRIIEEALNASGEPLLDPTLCVINVKEVPEPKEKVQ